MISLRITSLRTELKFSLVIFRKRNLSIILQHKLSDDDGPLDDEEDLIEEHFFVISPDTVQDMKSRGK